MILEYNATTKKSAQLTVKAFQEYCNGITVKTDFSKFDEKSEYDEFNNYPKIIIEIIEDSIYTNFWKEPKNLFWLGMMVNRYDNIYHQNKNFLNPINNKIKNILLCVFAIIVIGITFGVLFLEIVQSSNLK